MHSLPWESQSIWRTAEINSIHVCSVTCKYFCKGYHSYLRLPGIGWQVAVCRVTVYQRCSFPSRARENPWDPWRGVQRGVRLDLASPCLAFQLRRHFSPFTINPSRCHHRNNNNNNNNYKFPNCRKFDNTAKTTHPLWLLDHSRDDRKIDRIACARSLVNHVSPRYGGTVSLDRRDARWALRCDAMRCVPSSP
jgi:hypothetical protein